MEENEVMHIGWKAVQLGRQRSVGLTNQKRDEVRATGEQCAVGRFDHADRSSRGNGDEFLAALVGEG
jgi:hypothetical protein